MAILATITPLRVLSVLFALIPALALAYGLFLAAYYLLRKSYRALRRDELREKAKMEAEKRQQNQSRSK